MMDLTIALKVIPGSWGLVKGFPVIWEQSQEGGKQLNHLTWHFFWGVGFGVLVGHCYGTEVCVRDHHTHKQITRTLTFLHFEKSEV